MMLDLTQSVKGLASKMDARFTSMDARFDTVDMRFTSMDARFDTVDMRLTGVEGRLTGVESRLTNIEDAVVDLRQEMTDEATATRALLGQAFEHISDQMASKDQAIQPSLIFRHSRSRTRATV